MLYVYHGTDIEKSLIKARTLVNSLRAKKADATYIEITADNWDRVTLEENIGGQGLFSSKYIIFLNRVTEKAEAKEILSEFVEAMHESTNIFILLEGKLNAELLKSVEKYAEKVVETLDGSTSSPQASKKGNSEFNVFSLADAVGTRNVLSSWNIYRQAIDAGLEPESIIGTLFWQVKSMIVARDASSAASSGLSPFVYTKAKKAADNYTKEELDTLLGDLINIYHDSHRGLVQSELAIEGRLLKLKG